MIFVRYKNRSTMYIRGLIPRNCPRQFRLSLICYCGIFCFYSSIPYFWVNLSPCAISEGHDRRKWNSQSFGFSMLSSLICTCVKYVHNTTPMQLPSFWLSPQYLGTWSKFFQPKLSGHDFQYTIVRS